MAVVLHGCYMRAMDMIDNMSGWASLAYQNDMVLLFPQVTSGCWDNNDSGYGASVSGDKYGTNEGVQETALMAMV